MNLLAIDIGNTNTNFGIFRGNKIIKSFMLPTLNYKQAKFKKLFGRAKIDNAVICSVVPQATKFLEKTLKAILACKIHIVGKNILVPIKNLYRKPLEVGQDRLVNAYAGVALYGTPLITIDFGTAVTFDVISKNKEYLGGMIIPGLEISLNTLADNTALLPKIKLGRPKEFIGKDTKNSMLGGIIFGFAALTDDLAKRIKEKIGKNAKVVGTGGNIRLIHRYCEQIDKIDPDLTLKGLMLIYQDTNTPALV